MNYAWQGKVEEAASVLNEGRLVSLVREGFERSYGNTPLPAEVAAWEASIPKAINALAQGPTARNVIILEYRLPFNGQRADMVLIGKQHELPSVHVVELKHWSQSDAHPSLDHFVLAGGRESPHPSYQAATYAGKLRYFHSEAQNWDVSASALVDDRSADLHNGLKAGKYVDLWTVAPVFLPGESNEFRRHVEERIGLPASPSIVKAFLDGKYSQSVRLLDALAKHQAEIRNRAMASLAVSGWGLSDEQLLVFDRIIAAAASGEPSTFLLSGGPGSGKTLLAVHLLLALASHKVRTVLAVRNNRLNAALKAVLELRLFGAIGVIKYFSTMPMGRNGVEDEREEIASVLVCDEGQRLSLKSDNVFHRAPVTVILYDEGQILNKEEAGTAERLQALASGAGKPVTQLSLPTLHRCRGGRAYLEWVERLLDDPKSSRPSRSNWAGDYLLEISPSPKSIIDRLAKLRGKTTRVAMLASFTRSSGRDREPGGKDLGRIRIPEVDPAIKWLMNPEREYVPFWVKGRSNELTDCASIYGCQGFETDYAGLVWGDDLVIRDGAWHIGNPTNCYDTAPGATKLSTLMRKEPDLALRLLRNRYRILLTRGIFGTFIYCEDRETQEFLSGALN